MEASLSICRLLGAALVTLALIQGSCATSTPNLRLSSPPGYKYRDVCPSTCHQSGPESGNWSLYHNFDQIQSCDESLWYDFTLLDQVDDASKLHRIYACTNYGWAGAPANTIAGVSHLSKNRTTVTYEFGYWSGGNGSSIAAIVHTLTGQLAQYISKGFAPSDRATLLFLGAGSASMGLYIGTGIQSESIGYALDYVQNATKSSTLNLTDTLAMQFCKQDANANHIFGLIATGNSSFATVQNALASWSNASCLSMPESSNMTGTIVFTSPLFNTTNTTLGSTNVTSSNSSATVPSRLTQFGRRDGGTCTTIQVASGDSCWSLSQSCDISESQFEQYNPGKDFCNDLQPKQHVCCTAGGLPDYAPKPQADGTCASYKIVANDNCASLASQYSLTIDEIEDYNKDTWAWNGCSELFVGTIMCLSTGNPPMPAALSNAVCGPQVPGTTTPPAGTNISLLNPCPLNACCDVWGQCGITAEFCTNTNTGAPGTAAPGQNGCISNCGTSIIQSSAPSQYMSVGFFEGYNLGRKCLYQTSSQIDTSSWTHVFFSFGTLDASNYSVQVGDTLSTFEFGQFQKINGPKKILSIGGWAFSTDPATYDIFRTGVTAANRQAMANEIAFFVLANDLDGVNIDWEYPGAPDIPGIPPASQDDGANYLEMLKLLRAALGDSKEISVAAPSSYWYLRGFPIGDMSEVLDYVIFMTYDLHGQWDANNQWSQEGCPTGTCLRSDINITETLGALTMITKAGMPSNKVIVGVTSYGRSFAMAEAGCYGPTCQFLGSASDSQATPGICTDTAGYIANAEINQILTNSSRVNQNFYDESSGSNILVYDDTQWVGYMDDKIKKLRSELYQGLSMGGVADWATDLAEYNPPPAHSKTWAEFISKVAIGSDPYALGTGNWTTINCQSQGVQDVRGLTPSQRWQLLDGSDAWSDVVSIWQNTDEGNGFSFSASVSLSVDGPEDANCGALVGSNCEQTQLCSYNNGTGAAGYEIWNSFVYINELYVQYWTALNGAAATKIDNGMTDFENTFAPVPPPKQTPIWEEILIALVTLGVSMAAAPVFNIALKALPIFEGSGSNALGVIKDISSAMITYQSNIAKDVVGVSSSAQWTAQDQASFGAYMGQSLAGWANVTSYTLNGLFSGDDAALSTLSTMIGQGNLIEGKGGQPNATISNDGITALENSVTRAFYGFSIPSIWSQAANWPFILDDSIACDSSTTPDSMESAAVQYSICASDGNRYWLTFPDGSPGSFKGFGQLPGINSLATSEGQTDPWGGVTLSDLITGSLNSYSANGNQNGGPMADPTSPQTVTDLSNQDITTPGYINIPVCSSSTAKTAMQNPDRVDINNPLFPCVPLQGLTQCSQYTWTDNTSGGSPSVSDCQTIIKNIQNTDGKWSDTLNTDRQLVQFGTCALSVEETTSEDNGNGGFYIGSQDIVDLISNSISMYASNGLVGASGSMSCDGNIKQQPVTWYLYHT